MTDLTTLPLSKRHIQLRACLSPEVLHTLHYRLQIPQDDSTPIEDLLTTLDSYFKAQTNEALRRRELFSCRQSVGEQFNEFFVRVKNLVEAVDVCKGGNTDCEEMQMKQVILMGVIDQELVQELIGIIPTHSLDKVVQHCYAFEAARRTANAITSPAQALCAVSRYKKDKKARQHASAPTQPLSDACDSCGRPHAKGECSAALVICSNCGIKGHRVRMPRCPAINATCKCCGKQGHFDRCCRSSKPAASSSALAKCNKSPGPYPRNKNKYPSSCQGTGVLTLLPDTGADTTIIGADHLNDIGLTLADLHSSPQRPTYSADGSPMQPVIGSVQVKMTVKGHSIEEWIHVYPDIPVPLLSYRACRDLALIPERFPAPIAQVTHAAVRNEDDMLVDVSAHAAVTVRAIYSLASSDDSQPATSDVQLEELQQAARTDETYIRLLNCVRNGFPCHRYDLHSTLLDYWKIRDELYCDGDLVLYGPRIVVPAASRKSVLRRLHDSHRGAEATKRRAQQTVFWPGINSDITNVVRACDACQMLLPSQQREVYRNDDKPTRPYESISADYFQVAGKSFLVIVDRLSGWPDVYPCGSNTTTAATIDHFSKYFSDHGAPVRLRTDGGPQFAAKAFSDFLLRWKVQHILTSPHHPQSNGHAEAAVKSLKHLILKVAPSGNIRTEVFDRGLLEMRNTLTTLDVLRHRFFWPLSSHLCPCPPEFLSARMAAKR
ncbi:uncharacterized protein LOC123505380 [Portunus trituberculatus]|uniref:uncharacterized protein LOC123505380 n=1 Tax=Portunus trituberculatus TaxID=210409 RepID=UPI001E1CF2C3|nr:uncharacterized protein LOC123505380 [Portunus trituberculatus]